MERYNVVMKDSRYRPLTSRPEFQETFGLLKAYRDLQAAGGTSGRADCAYRRRRNDGSQGSRFSRLALEPNMPISTAATSVRTNSAAVILKMV